MNNSKDTRSRYTTPNVVASLRRLVPQRPLSFTDSLRLAELQANRLLEAARCTGGPVPESVITDLPRLDVRRSTKLIGSGVTAWSGGKWRMLINGTEPITRQRFTMAHELKHVLDSSHEDVTYKHLPDGPARERHIEAVCDHFAASLLMPRMWVKRLWFQGVQDLGSLAWHFGVSQQAMLIRLQALGLIDVPRRCLHAQRIGRVAIKAKPAPRRYHRAATRTFPTTMYFRSRNPVRRSLEAAVA